MALPYSKVRTDPPSKTKVSFLQSKQIPNLLRDFQSKSERKSVITPWIFSGKTKEIHPTVENLHKIESFLIQILAVLVRLMITDNFNNSSWSDTTHNTSTQQSVQYQAKPPICGRNTTYHHFTSTSRENVSLQPKLLSASGSCLQGLIILGNAKHQSFESIERSFSSITVLRSRSKHCVQDFLKWKIIQFHLLFELSRAFKSSLKRTSSQVHRFDALFKA